MRKVCGDLREPAATAIESGSARQVASIRSAAWLVSRTTPQKSKEPWVIRLVCPQAFMDASRS